MENVFISSDGLPVRSQHEIAVLLKNKQATSEIYE
jgi:hypothetical protein